MLIRLFTLDDFLNLENLGINFYAMKAYFRLSFNIRKTCKGILLFPD